ncbi:MAG: glycosyltransferase family 4 protein [Armatimonadota bacterium]|nr:glycosyltransferase family 4 protein [Armatimonadota bacterium]
MKIAQVAPLYESVPPHLYGGTERVVWTLTEELVRRGHDVTLFASGDSRTTAKLVPCHDRALRLTGRIGEAHAATTIQLDMVYGRAEEFDLIHNHIDYHPFPLARLVRTPTLTTLHGRLDLPDIRRLAQHFRDLPLVSVSRAQRRDLPGSNWVGTVYHGIPLEHYTLRTRPGNYLAFLGRISIEKRLDRAIEVARAADMPLKVAAKIDPADREYYEHAIKPLLNHPLVEYIGEIDEQGKDEFLGNAYAYVFPIDWPEPFGLTMIEAMATGTPVIATACGSVPEIVESGVTGFVCRSLDEMVRAVHRVPEISREACRRHVEARFSAARMAADYEAVYERLVGGRTRVRREPVAATAMA